MKKAVHSAVCSRDATAAPFKEYLRIYLEWDIRTTLSCGADIRLNTLVSADLVAKEDPDAVIVATGSNYLVPPIPGIDGANVKSVIDVESHRAETGERVVVCGGGLSGLECALTLAMEGKDVTVIDMIPVNEFCVDMPIFNKADLFDHLKRFGVRLIGERRIVSFSEKAVEVSSPEGKIEMYEADTCVNALGVEPDNKLGLELLGRYGNDVFLIGDCVSKGRTFYHANQEAYHASMRV